MFSLLFNYKRGSQLHPLIEENIRLKKINKDLSNNLLEYESAGDVFLEKITDLCKENSRIENQISELLKHQSAQHLQISSLSEEIQLMKSLNEEYDEKEHELQELLFQEKQTTVALKDYLYFAAHDSEKHFSSVGMAFNYLYEKINGRENLPDIFRLLHYQQVAIEEFRAFISDLFFVAKIEAMQIDHVIPCEIQIKDFFRKILYLLDIDSCMLDKQSVFLIFTTTVPETIYSDVTMLRQIVVNLLINAKERTTGVVFVLLHGNDTHFSFQIMNEGDPMTDDVIAKAFERNFTTNRVSGKGVGLTITKMLTQSLGGSISASNQKNVGPVFSVSLPVAYNTKNI